MFKELLSPTIIASLVFLSINIVFLKSLKSQKLYKNILINIISIFIFWVLKIPDNYELLKPTSTIYPYFTFLHIAVFTFFTSRTLSLVFVDLLFKKFITQTKIFLDIVKSVIFIIAIIFLLKANGVSVNSIFTTSAILTAVIGLALQNTLSDIVAGLILSTEDTIKINDWVDYNGKIGRVVQFSWRYTKIITLENEILIIPNKELTSNTIKSLSSGQLKHYIIIPFGVTYDNIPNEVIQVVKSATENIHNVSERHVYFVKYGDFAIEFEIRVRLYDESELHLTKSDILTKVFYALGRAKMEIPIPRYDLFKRDYEEASLEEKHLEVKAFFSQIDFLKILKEEELLHVIHSAKFKRYAHSEYILKQQTTNHQFFYIKSGVVDIIINDNKVAELKQGNFFGEMSLMTGEKTSATVQANGDVEVYILESHDFSYVLKNNKNLVEQISAVITKRKSQSSQQSKNQKQRKQLDKEKNNLKKKIANFFSL